MLIERILAWVYHYLAFVKLRGSRPTTPGTALCSDRESDTLAEERDGTRRAGDVSTKSMLKSWNRWQDRNSHSERPMSQTLGSNLDTLHEKISTQAKIADQPSGASDLTGHNKLKCEVARLRKLLAEQEHHRHIEPSTDKDLRKHSKAMKMLEQDIADMRKSHSETQQTCAKLAAECHQLKETVAAVEANLTCPICLNLFLDPYILSPCGHVLCLGCLREWFRTAPSSDSDEEDYPMAVLYRRNKSCPVCRAQVFDRPMPAYIIKTIASAFEEADPGGMRGGRFGSPSFDEDDPWSGLFPAARCVRRRLSWES